MRPMGGSGEHEVLDQHFHVARPTLKQFGEAHRPDEIGDVGPQDAGRCTRYIGFLGNEDLLARWRLVEPVAELRRLRVPVRAQGEVVGVLRLAPYGSVQPGGQLRCRVTGHRRASDRQGRMERQGLRTVEDFRECPDRDAVVPLWRTDEPLGIFQFAEGEQVDHQPCDPESDARVCCGREDRCEAFVDLPIREGQREVDIACRSGVEVMFESSVQGVTASSTHQHDLIRIQFRRLLEHLLDHTDDRVEEPFSDQIRVDQDVPSTLEPRHERGDRRLP